MALLSPQQLLWLGLLVPLVALYVLKRRRRELRVPSTLLWESALKDLRAERPFRRLLPHLSLLLQILIVLAGAAALARPAGAGGVRQGERVVAVVDSSASMGARDEGGTTRLEAVRAQLSALASSLPAGAEMMLIEAGPSPELSVAPTDDPAKLRRRIAELEVRGPRADLPAALALAMERAGAAGRAARVVLFTDLAFADHYQVKGAVPLEVRRVGRDLANTAIVAADVRAREPGSDRADVFVRLQRFGDTPAGVFVTAELGSRVVASRRVDVAAEGVETVVMTAELPPDTDARAVPVTIRLAAADGGSDALPYDDLVALPSPGARRLPVFLVGDAPAPLVRVFAADPAVELYETDLEQLGRRDSDGPALDGLHVFIGRVPPEPPVGESVVLAPADGLSEVFGVPLGPSVPAGRVVTWQEHEPLLRFLTPADMRLLALRPILGSQAAAVLVADGGVAIASLRRGTSAVTLLGFDPARGSFREGPGFVVLFRNLLEGARRRRAAGGVVPGAIGEALQIPAGEGEAVSVELPFGDQRQGRGTGGLAIVQVPAQPGAYRIRTETRELFALRNLLDPEESDLRARGGFERAAAEGAPRVTDQRIEHTEWWPFLALLLLVLLTVEVWWAHRGATA